MEYETAGLRTAGLRTKLLFLALQEVTATPLCMQGSANSPDANQMRMTSGIGFIRAGMRIGAWYRTEQTLIR